jgi:S1-C subfamily serine protease
MQTKTSDIMKKKGFLGEGCLFLLLSCSLIVPAVGKPDLKKDPQIKGVEKDYSQFFDPFHKEREAQASKPPLSVPQIVKLALPAVVVIQAIGQKTVISPFGDDPFFSLFFGARSSPRRSSGSGVIIDPRGYIVTCAHVIENSSVIRVTLGNGTPPLKATCILVDPFFDLALLKIDSPNKNQTFPYLSLAQEAPLVGDSVVAIGNSFSVGQTVTHGIVSAAFRVFCDQVLFQTDAPINPGNSGGPILNDLGEIVGISNAIASKTGGSHGVGFFIPSIAVATLVRRALKNQPLAIIPVLVQTLDASVIESLEAINVAVGGGCIVTKICDSSIPLEPGDLIISVGNQRILNEEMFKFMCRLMPIGEKYTLSYIAAEELTKEHPQIKNIVVTSKAETPPQTLAKESITLGEGHLLEGVVVAELSPELAAQLKLSHRQTGVVVLEKSSRTDFFKVGDIILEINGTRIHNLKDFQQAVQSLTAGTRSFSFSVNRDGVVYQQKYRF